MPAFEIGSREEGAAITLTLRGSLTLDDAEPLRGEMARLTRDLGADRLARFDLSCVDEADGAVIARLLQLEAELRARRVAVEFVGPNEQVEELLSVYSGGAVTLAEGRPAEDVLSRLGRSGVRLTRALEGWLGFLGGTAVAAANVARRPRGQNWRAIAPLAQRAGVGSSPFVVLVTFFVGVAAAFEYGLAVASLGAAGAGFVPALLGVSIAREFAPLMTAIVVAGLIGAPFTAELGTAKVWKESDALRALGVDPIGFLVLPRMLAILLTLPILTLMADCAGILGGLLVSFVRFGVSPREFLYRLQAGLALRDVMFGLSKSVVFALAIASVACRQGLSTWGRDSGVGRRTAFTVVSILLVTVVIDALFARGS